ncbi:MAG: hypothetical protein ACR2NR_05455 [Solirubrobacteraceae bacterium]
MTDVPSDASAHLARINGAEMRALDQVQLPEKTIPSVSLLD